MKKILILPFLTLCININAQKTKRIKVDVPFSNYSYLSFNPFSITEPQLAVGLGYGNRFTKRSEVFTELNYVAKHPIYEFKYEKLNGIRLIAEYRYHFLQQWKPLINLGEKIRERKSRTQPFIGIQFRLKTYRLIDKANFTNFTDTLKNYRYIANIVSLGGAFTLGATYNISKNKKWQLELSGGLGAKQKFVNYKNVLPNYKVLNYEKSRELYPPKINDEIGTPVFPTTVRLRYMLR